MSEIKKKVRDSVFTKLFSQPKYALELYKVLHPEEKSVREEDIKIFTIENVFINDIYNDIGFVVGKKLLLLVEAQSTWNPNMAVRGLLYLAESYKRYFNEENIDLYSTKAVELPVPEFYVIYTGERENCPEEQKFSNHFVKIGGKTDFPLEIKVKMIYNSDEKNIVYQYIRFCKVYTHYLGVFKGDKGKAIRETIKICMDEKLLTDFLNTHRMEVSNMFMGMDEEWLRKVHYESERKIAIEEGLQQGLEQGLQKGLKQGRQEGLQQGRAEFQLIIEQQAARIRELEALLAEKN